MFKKTILGGLLFAASAGMAFADSLPLLYAGASVGVLANTSNNAANTTNPGNFRGFPFNIFLGYGGLVEQDFYLAGELFGTLATAEISDNNGMKTSYGFGASIIPGMYMSEATMLFGRFSLLRSNFSSVSELTTGVQFGLGLQTAMMPMVDLRLEYDYTAFSSVSGINSPRQDAATLGFVYKFE